MFRWLFGFKKTDPHEMTDEERRLLATRPARPKRRGRTPEQRKADDEAYAAELRRRGISRSGLDRRRQMASGITHYRWRSMGDERTCPTCRKRDGKRFAWANPPPGGHPGEGACEGCGHCRCFAEPIFPGA